jgi:cytoskeletal protein RodZ
MLKILGFLVGALFTIWAFNKFVSEENQEQILEATDVVANVVADQLEQADIQQIVERSTQAVQHAVDAVEAAENKPTVDQTDIDVQQNEDEAATEMEVITEVVEVTSEPVEMIVSIGFDKKHRAEGQLVYLLKKESLKGINLRVDKVTASQKFAVILVSGSREEAMIHFELIKVYMGDIEPTPFN